MNKQGTGVKIISRLVSPGMKILDLGCGDGALLEHLRETRDVQGWGVDIDYQNVLSCIRKGISVFQGDIEEGLSDFKNDLYDFVIINQTLQEIRSMERLLLEALRIGNRVIVTYPNFGFVSNRFYLFFRGHSPVTRNFPYAWYKSPNVHVFTASDFRIFCGENNVKIIKEIPYNDGSAFGSLIAKFYPNLFAQYNLVLLEDL